MRPPKYTAGLPVLALAVLTQVVLVGDCTHAVRVYSEEPHPSPIAEVQNNGNAQNTKQRIAELKALVEKQRGSSAAAVRAEVVASKSRWYKQIDRIFL